MSLHDLPKSWDLIIIGGGITGAGIFREASRMGLNVLLVEQKGWFCNKRVYIHSFLRRLEVRPISNL